MTDEPELKRTSRPRSPRASSGMNNANVDEISARLSAIEETQHKLTTQLEAIAKNINGANIKEMQQSITRIKEIVDGDDSKDIPGLRKRVRSTEDLSRQLAEERNKIRWILTGVALTGLTNLGTLITLLAKVFGASP